MSVTPSAWRTVRRAYGYLSATSTRPQLASSLPTGRSRRFQELIP